MYGFVFVYRQALKKFYLLTIPVNDSQIDKFYFDHVYDLLPFIFGTAFFNTLLSAAPGSTRNRMK